MNYIELIYPCQYSGGGYTWQYSVFFMGLYAIKMDIKLWMRQLKKQNLEYENAFKSLIILLDHYLPFVLNTGRRWVVFKSYTYTFNLNCQYCFLKRYPSFFKAQFVLKYDQLSFVKGSCVRMNYFLVSRILNLVFKRIFSPILVEVDMYHANQFMIFKVLHTLRNHFQKFIYLLWLKETSG